VQVWLAKQHRDLNEFLLQHLQRASHKVEWIWQRV